MHRACKNGNAEFVWRLTQHTLAGRKMCEYLDKCFQAGSKIKMPGNFYPSTYLDCKAIKSDQKQQVAVFF